MTKPATGYPDGVPPSICDIFEEFALMVASKGYKRYSARTVLHRIRWHVSIDKGERGFKCNNNWTPHMARWFLEKHPELPKFFELRERTAPDAQWINE